MGLLAALVLVLTGCGGPAEASQGIVLTVVSRATPTVGATQPAPPSPAVSTATLAPTFTSVPAASPSPSVTAPLTPSATAPALPSATASASATVTAVPSATVPAATATAAVAPSPTAWPTPDGPLTRDERALLFDELWAVVNERYIDPNFNGVNWAAQRDARRTRALNAATDTAYYQQMREMMWTLNDGHSRFMDPHEAYDHFAISRNTLTYGGLGLYTFQATNGDLVLQVNPGSPAARAGIQPCDHILSMNGYPYDGDGGAVGTTANLTVQRPGDQRFTLTLTREEIQQVLDVPGQVLPNRSRRIGYIRVDTLWVFETPDRMRATLAQLEADGPLDGLIIDLRPNLGGWRPVLQGILGTFTEGQLGEFYGRLQTDPLVAPRRDDPPPSHPDLPLAVLVSRHTESYAEVLAATLQASRGAVVIGEQTRGNVETIFPRRLPFSARVWIAEQGFRLNNGATLEGIGVRPDVVDRTDWTEYACARDPQVDMAATMLENR